MRTKVGTLVVCVFFFIMALFLLTPKSAYAAPLSDVPVTVTQPDGTELNLLASGDEFYNWLHDSQGYTILQDPDTGYYVYANLVNGELVPTDFIAGRVDPASMGLRPNMNISPEKMLEIRQAFLNQTQQTTGQVINAPTSGTINNLVVFIRFASEAEFTDLTSRYTGMLNDAAPGANSLHNYYLEVSYNALTINSLLFPTPGTTVVSYQDTHTRGYFQPYNAVTNPGGYTGGDNGADRRLREHALLQAAINYVNGLGQFPSGAQIDADSDGYVDSLTFIISGSPTGWNSLLWPHQWVLYSYQVSINGKTVWEYSFQLNSSLYTGVLAHETFHVLGAPDLYHYSGDGLQPVGGWDVMEADQNPPQHMGCYMKSRYGHWISSIPLISSPGTYSLNPLTSPTNNCFKIASPMSTTQFFVVEYRREASSIFENSLPATGMLVYRINTAEDGKGNKDGPPDEVYIYRPGGTLNNNGSINTANFSSDVGRTAINDATNPSSFLADGSAGGLNLCNIGASGATISFQICGTTKIYLPIVKTTPINQPPTDILLSSNSIAENQPINTVVGTLSTTDPNVGDTFTYSLVGGTGSTDNGSFNISGNQLRTSAVFDYDVKNSYAIRLRTTDQGGQFFEKAFTITVTQVQAWETLVNTTFEGDFPGPWNVFDNDGATYGTYYWASRNCKAFAGTSSGWAVGGGTNGSGLSCGSNYPDYADSWMKYGPFSLVNATAAQLNFKLWIYSELDYDGVCRMASINGINFYGSCASGNSAGWVDSTLDLSNVYTLGDLRGQAQVWVAIIFTSDYTFNQAEGAYVDNVVVRRCMAGTCQGSPLNESEVVGSQIIERNYQATILDHTDHDALPAVREVHGR